MDAEIFVPFVFFGFLTAIILTPKFLRARTARSAHDLVSQALARGQTLDPDLVSQLTRNIADEGNRARKSLGNAVVLIALALGFVGAGFVINGLDHDGEAIYAMGIPAVILASVGLAYLLLAVIDYASKKKSA